MENSDSGDEGDESAAQRRNQTNRLAQDFYRFVNNLSEDEYKLMKGNNLLGNPGESTEEELRRRIHLAKDKLLENSDENTGEGDAPDDVSSSDSLLDWLMSFEPTENVTSGQREPQPQREVSQVNPPSEFRFSSGSSSVESKYVPSIRFPRGQSVENGHNHLENPQAEPRLIRPSKSEQSTPRPSIKVTPTRGQKRTRSRSPDHSRTRARTESRSPPRSLGPLSQRFHHRASTPTSGSIRDQLNAFEQTKNVVCGKGEHQPWREVSQANPHGDFRFSSGHPGAENKYAPSTRLPRRENMENSHSHVENPQAEPRLTRPSTSEQSTPRPSIRVTPTRGQKRARSRSPDHSRTRARTESRSPPRALGPVSQRFHHRASFPTFEQAFVSETGRFLRTRHQETSTQPTAALESQNRHLFATSGTRNAVQGESSPDTTGDGESCGLRQIYPNICLCSAVGRVHPVAYSERGSITNRTQITSEIPNNTAALDSEQGDLRHMFSHYEQADMRAYVSTIGIPFCGILSTGFSDTIPGAIQSTLRQTVTDFSGSSSPVDSESDLEPTESAPRRYMERAESPNGRDSSHGRSFSSNSNCSCDSCLHSTSTSSSNSSYTSGSSSSYTSGSSFSLISSSSSSLMSSSSSSLMSSSSSSLMSSSSSSLMSSSSSSLMSSSSSSPISSSSSFSDENSEISTLFFEGSYERRFSPYSSETWGDSRSMTPITSDESDSWASLDQFLLVNDYDNHPTGLSKAEIDNLAIRPFSENDTSKVCIICMTEYTEGNKLRILPCSHEYHVHCIDRWLSDNSTCPICRREVVGSG
ncbi:E3 ubiquitin-protein ligase RLIM-like [Myotis lucifugus]|uniref:E3 ubiquitin-protein ligase RLIM-like n=1 Tax=Myotis lucifugus TaxID=59463 RepID=UPI0006D72000|nr:E3 ubiquitin-protein ligase RLIM-like [Myotis lucifugus]